MTEENRQQACDLGQLTYFSYVKTDFPEDAVGYVSAVDWYKTENANDGRVYIMAVANYHGTLILRLGSAMHGENLQDEGQVRSFNSESGIVQAVRSIEERIRVYF